MRKGPRHVVQYVPAENARNGVSESEVAHEWGPGEEFWPTWDIDKAQEQQASKKWFDWSESGSWYRQSKGQWQKGSQKQIDQNQPAKKEDRSRSPVRPSRRIAAALARAGSASYSGSDTWGSAHGTWKSTQSGDLDTTKLGTVSKAAPAVPSWGAPKTDVISAVQDTLEEAVDDEAQKFGEALLRCLPEDIRPASTRGGYKGIVAACHAARGERWPKLDVVGGGAGGTSTVTDLHELSVALLNRVKEKALEGAVPVDEGRGDTSDLTTMFVKENRLGPSSEAALRKLPVAANLRVIGAGSITGCDPQAVILARIRRARDAAATRVPDGPLDITAFIEENWVSTEIERTLRSSSDEVQRQVLAEGPLLGQTPSAELQERLDRAHARVRQALILAV